MANSPFIHLHTHSHYSLLEGLSKVKEMVTFAQKDGMPALALTDHGNMHGAIDFYKTCKAHNIKPIIGLDAYYTAGSRHEKRSGIDTERFGLVLLAQNETGYKNLMRLVSKSYLEGFYYKPRIDLELLKEHNEGLICLSGGPTSELVSLLKDADTKRAEAYIHQFTDIFGERFFLEILPRLSLPHYNDARAHIIALAKKMDVPLVAAQSSYYLHPDDKQAHETLLSVQQNRFMSDVARLVARGDDFSFIDTKTAYKRFQDVPEAIENTQKVADMCDLEISDLGNWMFPEFHIPENSTYDEELKKLTYQGIQERDIEQTKEVKDRIEYELGIIKDKKYASYFLVVADMLRHAKREGILTNTRGSAAGSMVSFLVGITSVNPLELRLPFERFLNPERPSLPDIDMDFADNRRDEIIQYMRDKYGEDKVAQIGTFGTMLARGSVRDVARALGYAYEAGDRIARLIPLGAQGFPMTIDRALKETPELKDMYEKETEAQEIIDLAKRIEGCARHVSVHAAGVVIGPKELTEYTPLQFDPKGGKIITQYDMYTGDREGVVCLPKFDVLGITNLTILQHSVALVKKRYGKDIDVETIPLDDPHTYKMLTRGETVGVFQLAGSGMTRYLMELKPTNIDDINAMVALYRPGPLAFIPDYIKRKRNPQLVKYLDPRLKDILEPTYGILIYQDDILLIAVHLAGYSWGEADKFRKAVGKKIPEAMAEQKEKFISGCVDNGMRSNIALELWDMIETFAAYGFNKAHAASYGHLAYQTAYMKANFPSEYMAAVLTAESGDVEKIAEIIAECTHMGIPVLPPDINASFGDFTVVAKEDADPDEALEAGQTLKEAGQAGAQIRFGLYTIKNLGYDISDAIIEERKKNGAFSSFSDFLRRIKHRNLNKKSLEALIKAGAMDDLGERGQMIENLDRALHFHKEHMNTHESQDSLFGVTAAEDELSMEKTEPATLDSKLAWEKELLGLYISGHPLEKHKGALTEKKINNKKVKEEVRTGAQTIVGGIVAEAKMVNTKKGDRMAFVKIEDLHDAIEVVFFPKTFVEYKDFLEEDKCIVIKGKVSNRNGEKSIIADAVKEL